MNFQVCRICTVATAVGFCTCDGYRVPLCNACQIAHKQKYPTRPHLIYDLEALHCEDLPAYAKRYYPANAVISVIESLISKLAKEQCDCSLTFQRTRQVMISEAERRIRQIELGIGQIYTDFDRSLRKIKAELVAFRATGASEFSIDTETVLTAPMHLEQEIVSFLDLDQMHFLNFEETQTKLAEMSANTSVADLIAGWKITPCACNECAQVKKEVGRSHYRSVSLKKQARTSIIPESCPKCGSKSIHPPSRCHWGLCQSCGKWLGYNST